MKFLEKLSEDSQATIRKILYNILKVLSIFKILKMLYKFLRNLVKTLKSP